MLVIAIIRVHLWIVPTGAVSGLSQELALLLQRHRILLKKRLQPFIFLAYDQDINLIGSRDDDLEGSIAMFMESTLKFRVKLNRHIGSLSWSRVSDKCGVQCGNR